MKYTWMSPQAISTISISNKIILAFRIPKWYVNPNSSRDQTICKNCFDLVKRSGEQ